MAPFSSVGSASFSSVADNSIGCCNWIVSERLRRVPGVRLTADQRLVIERAYMAGLPRATFAALVGKHPSTISR